MFTIDSELGTYILSDTEAQSTIEVVPNRGGIVTRWSIQGQEILYLDSDRFKNPTLSVRGGIPILFPICGNLVDNEYTYNEQKYSMKQHGFARDLDWDVSNQQTDNSASITVVLKSSEQTREVYPFDFEVTFTYQLQGNSLKILQRYTNLSQEKMPFSAGFHPYFKAENKNALTFDIPASSFVNKGSTEVQPFEGSFDFNQAEIDVAFTSLSSNTTTVTDSDRRTKLTIAYSDFFSCLVFWTVKEKDFYCLEPWSAPRNALNTKEHLTYLEPGSSYEASVELTINNF